MKRALPLLLFFVLSLLAASVSAQESYKLKYNFEKGKTYSFNNKMDGIFTQEVMGREMKMTLNGAYSVKVAVENVNAGTADLITSLDSGRVTSKNPVKDTTISFAPFAGKRTRLTLLEDGTVKDTKVLDSIKMFNFQGLTQTNLMRFVKLPATEVKAGVPWNITANDTMDVMGTGKIVNSTNYTYTIVGKEKVLGHDCLKMTYTGDVKSSGKAQVMGMNFVIEGSGKISGDLFFDPKMGMTIRNDATVDNDMNLATTGQQNLIIPITESMKNSITLAE